MYEAYIIIRKTAHQYYRRTRNIKIWTRRRSTRRLLLSGRALHCLVMIRTQHNKYDKQQK